MTETVDLILLCTKCKGKGRKLCLGCKGKGRQYNRTTRTWIACHGVNPSCIRGVSRCLPCKGRGKVHVTQWVGVLTNDRYVDGRT